jgi:hypothetical protein
VGAPIERDFILARRFRGFFGRLGTPQREAQRC